MAELNGESLSFSENPSAKNEEDSFSHGKSGGSLRSQSETLKEGGEIYWLALRCVMNKLADYEVM